MSLRDQWLDRVTFWRLENTGIDPDTQRPKTERVLILEDEPCDFSVRYKRVAQQTNAGTVYNRVETSHLKIHPPNGLLGVPDENDQVKVNGGTYRVVNVRNFWDPGSGAYMGSALEISRVGVVDKTPAER